jgi:hypothetical protein
MAKPNKRITVYLEADLHKALQLKAIGKSKSVSDLVNKAVRDSLKKDKYIYDTIKGIMSNPGLVLKTKPGQEKM